MATFSTKTPYGPYADLEINLKLGDHESDPKLSGLQGLRVTWDNSQSKGEIFFDTETHFAGTLFRNLPNPDGPVTFEGDMK